MKIRNKFMLPIIGIMVLFALVGTVFLINAVSGAMHSAELKAAEFADQMYTDQLMGKMYDIEQNISRIANKGLYQAAYVSSLPEVLHAYESALEGNIDDEADPTVQSAREQLRLMMNPIMEKYRQKTGIKEVRLHFHLPNSRSFVRTWRDGWQTMRNGKKIDISDDLSAFRQTLVTINHGDHMPLTGVEVGRGGFVIRGIAPITAEDGRHLGSCEVYFSFAQLIDMSEKDKNNGLQLAAYMDKSLLSVATQLQDANKYPLLEDKYVLTVASDQELMSRILKADILDAGRDKPKVQLVGDYFVGTFPIRDFSGKVAGVFVMTHSNSALATMQASMASTATTALGSIKTGMSVGIAVVVLLIGAIIFWLSGVLTRPIGATVEQLTSISQGDLSKDVPRELQTRSDEMGEMARALQAMVENLRELINGLSEGVGSLVSSSGELTSVSNQTAAGVEDVVERSQSVAAAAEQASSNTASVASGMDQTTTSLSSVAGATEEMSATVSEIAANSEKARMISDQAMSQTQAVSMTMQELGEAAQEIDKVTETITEISSQTNLLALNATIEAARAGAAGKGFAVVAGEIKELARQTADATEDIKRRISGIQLSTGSAVSDTEQISQVISEVSDLVNSIAASIEEQSVVTRDVAGNIAQASSEVNDANERLAQTALVSQSIAEDVAGVSTTVEEIRQGNRQVSESANKLSELAQTLEEMVHKFNCGND